MITFTITLDDMMDIHRLTTRRPTIVAAVAVTIPGLVLTVVGINASAIPLIGGGLALIVLGALTLAAWRFPVIDRRVIRRRVGARIGAVCDVWLDDDGIAYRQSGISGHIDWTAITRVWESDQSLQIMQGRVVLLGIPKRAFGSADGVSTFIADIQRHVTFPHAERR